MTYGGYLTKIKAMNIIAPFDPWKNRLCACPPKYSLSPYTGCQHQCLYCYASSYIRNFYSARPKKDFLKRLEKDIKKIPQGSIITLSNSSDPYMPLEEKLDLTKNSLKILTDYAVKLIIVTKSVLILRDIEIIRNLKNAAACFTLTTLKKDLAEKLEPLAPSPEDRLDAIEKLSSYIPVICRFDPLIYPLNTNEIKELIKEVKKRGVKQIITSTYKAKPDNFNRLTKAFPEHKDLWHKLYLLNGERINRCIYLPRELREKLIKEVREISLQEKLGFSACREGFEYLNTKNCDGSSFLQSEV